MSRCPQCQHDNPSGARFCNGCGARAELACAGCGQVNPSGSRFCNGCGTKLGDPAPPGHGPRFTSPETYTPKHLAEKILTSKAALEGERKQVTVLFADLKGSMELLADRDPEEARRLLDPVLEHMMEAVHRYEGIVNQVMGDGIMALFGAPLAHEDHAVRACYAALRMQERVKTYAEEARRTHAAVVKIRVGLSSGEVVVRAIGSDLHMDYTDVGQTTHLAARMEQIADPGAIVIAPDTLALAEGYVEVRSLGPIPVKGPAAPVEIFELTGAGQARTRLQAAALRGLTRFVGRDAEVEHLRRVLDQAAAGRGQVVALVGEAGVGKSRLTYEFTHSHRVQDWLILEASSVSYGKVTSYALLLSNAVVSSAWVLAQAGEASEAQSRLLEGEKLVERQAASGLAGPLGGRYLALGRAALVLGRLDDARRLGDRATEFSPRQSGFAAHALHLLGDVAAHPDRFDAERGETHYRQALALAEPRGMRPLVAHCHLGLGTLSRRTGKRDQAREHLTTATAMYREMGMTYWLEQAAIITGARP